MTADRADIANRGEAAVRDLYWKPWDAPGCEHVRVSLNPRRKASEAVVADGLVLLYRDGQALRCHYRLTTDAHWRSRFLDLVVQTGGHEPREAALTLRGDGKGRWRVDGAREPALDGCLEIADLRAVYVPVPDLAPVLAEQSYACLRPLGLSGGLYRYESRASGFSADLPVDSGGFVVDYPDSFRRIW